MSSQPFIDPCQLVMPDVVTGSANQSLPTSVPFIPSLYHPAVPASNLSIHPAGEGVTVVQRPTLMNLPRSTSLPVRHDPNLPNWTLSRPTAVEG
jgi:hypothetical protein